MFEQELRVAKDIAAKASRIMLEYFDAEQEVEHKDDESEVTIADKKINSMVITELGKHFDDGVIGEEESNSEYGGGRKWICDPIDGTKAFVLGVPTAMFSLGLVVDGVPVLGVAYDPFLERLFWAVKDQGSFCNGNRLEVSDNELRGHYVGVSSSKRIIDKIEVVSKVVQTGAKLDMTYGAVYKSCMVATGKTVGYFESVVNPHDIAAVHIIVEEAGGVVTGYDGEKLDYTKPFKGAIISNKVAHDDLVKSIIG